MNRKWIIAILGGAAAGLLGYGASRYLKGRKESENRPPEIPEPKAPEDKKISQYDCPSCGKPVKEYEFFCPYCGHSPEKKKD